MVTRSCCIAHTNACAFVSELVGGRASDNVEIYILKLRGPDSGSKQPSLAYIRLANFYGAHMYIVLTGKLRTTPSRPNKGGVYMPSKRAAARLGASTCNALPSLSANTRSVMDTIAGGQTQQQLRDFTILWWNMVINRDGCGQCVGGAPLLSYMESSLLRCLHGQSNR